MKRSRAVLKRFAMGWMCLAAGLVPAADYTWVGEGADDHWTTSANWSGPTAYPGVLGDIATVTAADTVHLDTNGIVTLRRLSLDSAAAKTVTITGDAGAGFTFNGPVDGATGINVAGAAGNRLIIGPDVTMSGRFDKQSAGTAEFRGRFFSSSADAYSIVLRAGQTVFSGNASLTNLAGTVNLGVMAPASLLLTDQASCSVANLNLGISAISATRSEVIMDSPDCSLKLSGQIKIGIYNSGASLSNIHDVFRLRNGKVSAFNVQIGYAAGSYGAFELGGGTLATDYMTVGVNSPGTFTMTNGTARGSTLALGVASVGQPGAFEMSGGELMFQTNSIRAGSFRQTGGRSVMSQLDIGMASQTPDVTLAGGTMLLTTNVTSSWYPLKQSLRLSGGVLQVTNRVETQVPVRLTGGTAAVDTPLAADLLVLRAGLSGTGHLVKTGAGAVTLGYPGCTNFVSGSITVSNGVLALSNGSALESDAQSTNALGLTVCSGGTFRVFDISSVVSAPLALDIKSGGKLEFYGGAATSYNRNLVVARTFATNGIPLPKGKRYTSGALGAFISASGDTPSCSVVVPLLWTGAGDGVSWQDGANWEGGVAPNGADAVADLSLAERDIRLDSDVTLTCLVYSPQAAKRELALTGTGTLRVSWKGSGYYAPCVFVSGGRKLALDVALDLAAGGLPFAIVGGGTVEIRKGFMSAPLDSYAPCSVFGSLTFGGATSLAGHLYVAGHEISGFGTATFGENCVLSCARIMNGVKGFMPVVQLHDGAGVTCEGLWLTKHFAFGALVPTYKMRSGTLTVTGAYGLNVGVAYPGVSTWARTSAGGLFEMTGGTVRTSRVALDLAASGVTLNGGTLRLGTGGIVRDGTVNGKVKLGAVTIVAEGDWTSAMPMTLTGFNGSPRIDTQNYRVALDGALSGAGGLVKAGLGTLTLNGTNTFTGPLVAEGGTVSCGADSQLNGVTEMIALGGKLALNGTIGSSSLTLRLADTNSLSLPGGTELTVSRLYTNGVMLAAGSYAFGGATVTVSAPSQIVWTGAANDGNLWSTLSNWDHTAAVPDGAAVALDFGYSALPANAQIVLDVTPGVTLTNLTYDHGMSGSTLTVTCPPAVTNTFAFSANGMICVEEGQTLVLDTDVYLNGPLNKTGKGTLVLKRLTRSGDTFAAAALFIREGTVRGEGEFNYVRMQPVTALDLAQPPEFILEESGLLRNGGIALPGYDTVAQPEKGVFTQRGGTVDYRVLATAFELSNWGFIFANGPGDEGVYNLESGLLITGTSRPAYLSYNGSTGHFNQSGGTSVVSQLLLSQKVVGAHVGELNLSGGVMRLSGAVEMGWGSGAVNLSGGRIESVLKGDVFDADVPVALATGGAGDVAFAQAQATYTNTLPGTLSGSGGLVQEGPGTLELNGVNAFGGSVTVKGGTLLVSEPLGATRELFVDGGRLELLAEAPGLTNLSVRAADAEVRIDGTAVPFGDGLTLSLAQGMVTELDFDGIVDVEGLVLGGKARRPGLYGSAESQAPASALNAYFTGTGTLRVLSGPQPQATVIMLR